MENFLLKWKKILSDFYFNRRGEMEVNPHAKGQNSGILGIEMEKFGIEMEIFPEIYRISGKPPSKGDFPPHPQNCA